MVAFDPRVRMRCVTLEGDVYTPSGTLSGGSNGEEGRPDDSVLKRVKDLNKLEEELRFTEHKYNELKKELESIREKLKQQHDQRKQIELLQH
jgi:structural maintenance of chromosome 2